MAVLFSECIHKISFTISENPYCLAWVCNGLYTANGSSFGYVHAADGHALEAGMVIVPV